MNEQERLKAEGWLKAWVKGKEDFQAVTLTVMWQSGADFLLMGVDEGTPQKSLVFYFPSVAMENGEYPVGGDSLIKALYAVTGSPTWEAVSGSVKVRLEIETETVTITFDFQAQQSGSGKELMIGGAGKFIGFSPWSKMQRDLFPKPSDRREPCID